MNWVDFLHQCWQFLADWYFVPLLFLIIGVILTILIENRNPTKTIAWILVIVFIPILGVILYYFFGQKFKKVKKLKRVSREEAVRLERQFRALEPMTQDALSTLHQNIGSLSNVYTYLKNERLSLPSLNNNVELLINGEQMFPRLLYDIQSAEHSIHIEFYIFELDHIGKSILDALEERAANGVEVRLIVDALGSSALVKRLKSLQLTGVQVEVFLPLTFGTLTNSNYRNHRKVVVIDGKVGYIGGINISDRYINPNSDGLYWRDTAIRIVGESIALLQINFWTSWNQTEGESFELNAHYVKQAKEKMGAAAVSFVASDPGSLAPHNMEALVLGISNAEKKVQLMTPYYIPTPELETALMVAAASGVEVELMIPRRGDSWVVQHAMNSYLKPLLERGVKVYKCEEGFVHSKTTLIDEKLAYVGTVNLDTRSFYINYEIAAVVSESGFCHDMSIQFEKDKGNCTLLTIEEWWGRKKWKRGLDSLCRLLAPIL